MRALSAFVLPLAVGLSLYFLLFIFLGINQLVALLVAIIAAWTIRALLRKRER